MATLIEIKVPDIGGSKDVPVIELLAAVGDTIAKDQGLVTLESDKATMEVPSSAAGVVKEWKVKVGDAVSEGQVIAVLEAAADAPVAKAAPAAPTPAALQPPRRCRSPRRAAPVAATPRRKPPAAATPTSNASWWCSAPVPAATPPHSAPPTWAWTWCWSSATPKLGGVCLNVGCIPSKALLHAAEVIDEAKHAAGYGVELRRRRASTSTSCARTRTRWSARMNTGLAGMAKAAQGAHGHRHRPFVSANELEIERRQGSASCCASSNASSPPARSR